MIDQYGLIVQENGDGGDCPCRTGLVIAHFYAENMQDLLGEKMTENVQNILHTPKGWIRYPVKYNDPNDFSRDQASRLMLGYAMAGRDDIVSEYYQEVVNRAFRHPNGDPLGLSEVSVRIRSSMKKTYWLWLLDLQFFVNIISWRWKPWDTDNLFIGDLWWAQRRNPTWWSWLAAKLYDKEAAKVRIGNNLNSGTPGLTCKEAYEANMYFLETM